MAGQGAKQFPPQLEQIFGHGPDHYLHLLPWQIAAQTQPNPSRRGARGAVAAE
jgi:hypothetical protein